MRITLIFLFVLALFSCRKEENDTIKRPAPWVRYDAEDLSDTATIKTECHFGVNIFSVAGIKEYKIWVDDSIANEWVVEDEYRDERSDWQRVEIYFTQDIPETKVIIVWVKDRANAETTDSLVIKYKGGSPERGKIIYNPNKTYGTISVNGEIYKTINIGQQTWLARNLKVVPANGNYQSVWAEYDNVYGYVYNWQTAMSINSISGYILPSKQEWQELITVAGGSNGGGALKETGFNHWWIPNLGATNITGFTAISGSDAQFLTLISRAYFWTSTEQGLDSAWAVQLCFENSTVQFVLMPKTSVASVRLKRTSSYYVQNMLNDGETPQSIIGSGFPVDSLYGRVYQGGFIFYFNNQDNSGLVAAPNDYDFYVPYCEDNSLTNATGTAIGTGQQNTTLIMTNCGISGTSADYCNSLLMSGFSDWFLPSRDELLAIYTNLKLNGYGNLSWDNYWSSTESLATPLYYAEAINFSDGSVFDWNKYAGAKTRAIRKF